MSMTIPIIRSMHSSYFTIGEIETKRFLERHFRKDFVIFRPDFLKDIFDNKRLPLGDRTLRIYNDELKLAVEFFGLHHYEFVKRSHKTFTGFRKMQERDVLKKKLCEENGVRLVRVPHNVSSIEGYLRRRL